MTNNGRTYADVIAENRIFIYVVIIIIIAIVTWLAFNNVPVKVGAVEVGRKETKIDSVRPVEKVTINGNGNINGSNIRVYNVLKEGDTSPNNYSTVGFTNSALIERIQKIKKINIVPNSKKYIEITCTGEITRLDDESNAYYYTGGWVIINVNGNCTQNFRKLHIEEMRPSSKSAIKEEISAKINSYIHSNLDEFSKAISECIQN